MQGVSIIAYQSGGYFWESGVLTGTGSDWAELDTGIVVVSDFSTWFGSSSTLDFTSTGAPIVFGFAAGNSDSIDVSNLYDNWSLTITYDESTVIPEPATMLLLGSGLIGLAGFRRKFRKR